MTRLFKDIFGRTILLTQERLSHIKDSHPEMSRQTTKVRQTLRSPLKVVRSNSDPDVELFYRYYTATPVGKKYLCVVVKAMEDDYYMLTAYFTDRIKRGELLWSTENE